MKFFQGRAFEGVGFRVQYLGFSICRSLLEGDEIGLRWAKARRTSGLKVWSVVSRACGLLKRE